MGIWSLKKGTRVIHGYMIKSFFIHENLEVARHVISYVTRVYTEDLVERIEPCITNQEETHTYKHNVWNEI